VDSGIDNYESDVFPSDGSGLYWQMEFPKLTSQGDSVVMYLPLPTYESGIVDMQGFGWIKKSDKIYGDFSFLVDGETDEVTVDTRFLCGNKLKKSSVIGYCYNILPT